MPNQKNYSFLLAMAALAVSVGVAGYALLLANSLQGKNRALEAALLAYTSGNFGEVGNETTELEKATAEISGKLAESEAQNRILVRREIDLRQTAQAADQSALAQGNQADFARKAGLPIERKLEVAPGVNISFMLIPPGTFTMGSPGDEHLHAKDEVVHQVTISKGFYLARTETTQAQWQAVMGSNPSYFKTDILGKNTENLPVDSVSWLDANDFCKVAGKPSGKLLRLPTEAEWEYACRAGTTTPSHWGPVGRNEQGVFMIENLDVASFKANGFGLCDMHGNNWEWCSDWYGPLGTADQVDPAGPVSGLYRCLRGGRWEDTLEVRRSAFRHKLPITVRWTFHGVRLAMPLDERQPD